MPCMHPGKDAGAEDRLALQFTLEIIAIFGKAYEIRGLFQKRALAGEFLGALHSYEGQEAVAAGVGACLRPDDYQFSTHRGHGHAIAKGLDLRKMVAEMLGKATGCSRGRGGCSSPSGAERSRAETCGLSSNTR